MANRTVSASELRKQSGKLLESCNRELEILEQAKEQIAEIKQQWDQLKALNGTVVEENTRVSYGSDATTYTTIKTILDVYFTDGGMAEGVRRFNSCLAIFKNARSQLVRYCEAINQAADDIEANNEAILDALLAAGRSNVPSGNNIPRNNVVPGNNIVPTNNISRSNTVPSNNTSRSNTTPSNNTSRSNTTPSNNTSRSNTTPKTNTVPSNNTVPTNNTKYRPQVKYAPPGPDPNPGPHPEPTRTPTPTPSPSPTPTSSPTPTPSPSPTPTRTPTPTPTSSPTPTPTATGYEPIPYTGISDKKKDSLVSSMAFPIGAALAAAGVGAAIHEGLERYHEAKEKKENQELDKIMEEEVNSPVTRSMPFTVSAAIVTAKAGQTLEESLKRKKDD